jgi:protein-L-isoaspartate(D-aspartate) O-methyltransferase
MTHLLQVAPGQRILEIGTGSGYQAAVLGQMGAEVRTIEIVEPLAREAAERLRTLGYGKVRVRAGDGYAGWPEEAPFDRIIVTAGAPQLPQPLVDQLKPGGRMVIPIAARGGGEELVIVTKGPSRAGAQARLTAGQVRAADAVTRLSGRRPRSASAVEQPEPGAAARAGWSWRRRRTWRCRAAAR